MRTSQTEKTQENNDLQYPELKKNIFDGVAVYKAIDDGNDFIFCEHNRAGEQITGLSYNQVVGKRVTDVFPGIKTLGLLDVLRRVFKTEESEQYSTSQYSDKRLTFWVENTVYKLPSGNIVAIYRDVTEKKQAEDALAHLSLLSDTMLAVHRQLAIPQKTKKLIQKICQIFVEKQGYKSAWIVLLDKKHHCIATAHSGLLTNFSLLEEKLRQGDLPACIRQVLRTKKLVHCTTRQQFCNGCSIAGGYPDSGVMIALLQYEKRNYGVITVSLDKKLVLNPREQEQFKKMAADIAFALFNRQQEKKRLLAERKLAIRDKISRIFIMHQDNDLFGGVLDIVLDAMESELGVFGYLEGQDMLVCPSMTTKVWDQCQMAEKTIYFPREKWTSIWSRALQTGITQWSNNIFTVPEGHVPIMNSMASAIISGEKIIGLLQVANKRGGYDEQDQNLLENIAITLAPILQARLEQQKTQQALYRSKEEFADLYNNAPNMFVSVDLENITIIKCNQITLDKLGYTKNEFIGRSLFDFFHPDDIKEIKRDGIPRLLKTGKSEHKEHRLICKDGSILSISVDATVIRDNDGKMLCTRSVWHDITERKRIEAQLLISEKMTTIAGLAAGVAHEINTPLSGILQAMQIIEMSLDPTQKQNQQLAADCGIDLLKVQDYLQKQDLDYFLGGIKNSASTAARIIADLLQFSRPQESSLVQVSIAELINRSIELAKTDYSLKKEYNIFNVKFIRQGLSDDLKVFCMVMEIEQVFINLIRNSCQALVEKNDLPHSHIIFRTREHDKMVIIEVEDNGPGMDKETSQHAFDPFFTTKEVGKGTGLGLSVAYSIINDKHGGSIRIESTSKAGTLFIIELPTERI